MRTEIDKKISSYYKYNRKWKPKYEWNKVCEQKPEQNKLMKRFPSLSNSWIVDIPKNTLCEISYLIQWVIWREISLKLLSVFLKNRGRNHKFSKQLW